MTWSPQQKTHHTLSRKPMPSGLIERKNLLTMRCFPWKDFSDLRHPKLILVLSFFYFAFSCGLEAFHIRPLRPPHLPPLRGGHLDHCLLLKVIGVVPPHEVGQFSHRPLLWDPSLTSRVLDRNHPLQPGWLANQENFLEKPKARLAACWAPSSWRCVRAGWGRPYTLALLLWASPFPLCLPQVFHVNPHVIRLKILMAHFLYQKQIQPASWCSLTSFIFNLSQTDCRFLLSTEIWTLDTY